MTHRFITVHRFESKVAHFANRKQLDLWNVSHIWIGPSALSGCVKLDSDTIVLKSKIVWFLVNIDLPKLTDLKCTTGNFTNFKKAAIESRSLGIRCEIDVHCLSEERFKLGSLYLIQESPGEYKSFRMVEGVIYED